MNMLVFVICPHYFNLTLRLSDSKTKHTSQVYKTKHVLSELEVKVTVAMWWEIWGDWCGVYRDSTSLHTHTQKTNQHKLGEHVQHQNSKVMYGQKAQRGITFKQSNKYMKD